MTRPPVSDAPAFDALPPDDQFVIAMELWEATLELYRDDDDKRTEWGADFFAAFDAFGSVGMRDAIAAFVPFVWQAWEDRDIDKFDDCFDWVWCPLFLAQCVDWRDPAFPQLKPDWREIAAGWTSDAPKPSETAAEGDEA